MNRRKKLGVIGLLVIVLVSIFATDNINGFQKEASINQQKASFVEAQYFSQKDRYYCGQAVVQMALYMVQGIRVDQSKLADEMNFIKGGGTRPFNIIKSFNKRDIEVINHGVFRNLNHLRNCVDKGYYSIINIGFDERGKSGHFVLVTGYNLTGFFVHDPWPENWGQPIGRSSGEDAYIRTDLMQKLWLYRLNWVLTVAGPDSIESSSSIRVSEINR